MPKKKLNEAPNRFDYLEEEYGVTPGQILKAVEEIGPYKARLETYFSIHYSTKKTKGKTPTALVKKGD
jgi:hypothetical protein